MKTFKSYILPFVSRKSGRDAGGAGPPAVCIYSLKSQNFAVVSDSSFLAFS